MKTCIGAYPQEIPNLGEMTRIFLKLGAIGFGGGMAMIALMEDEFVKRRRCLAAEEFLHGVALGQILGSFPVNAALFIGYRLHGFWGGLVAGFTFLFPSLAAVTLFSWLYFEDEINILIGEIGQHQFAQYGSLGTPTTLQLKAKLIVVTHLGGNRLGLGYCPGHTCSRCTLGCRWRTRSTEPDFWRRRHLHRARGRPEFLHAP